ncbi:YeeE/YedE family protein [Paracoccus sp. IB05]|uniref:YeeE/YedE family protein n=1 Tax=Paracoccus sp. IB05 TaxID=2779367 RepID=UPI0018E818F0|nr:YeeE/YedE family protein [Paracoccus sp. IB05]MBJ2152240.1 YeeE/YedE family protein [Paracoccus sp. IB05]
MTGFTPWTSLAGGGLIGLAVVLLMALHGRILGVTGIVTGVLTGSRGWRLAFLTGAVLAPMGLTFAFGAVGFHSPAPWPWILFSGLLAGIGVSFGGGCTSGHGICGNARLSKRSAVATICFLLSAAATVYAIRHLIGGL